MWANFTCQRAPGLLLEVFVAPLDDGQARLSVVYDFTEGNVTWMGGAQDSGWMVAGSDPVLPVAEAEARAEAMREHRPRVYPVLYRANDPAGTAFISLNHGPAWLGLQGGMCCVLLALILSLPIPLPFLKVSR